MDRPVDRNDLPFEAAPAKGATEATVFTCGLCGLRFTHGGMTCGNCPLGQGCDTVGCPRCGHAFPRTSSVVEGLKVLARLKRLFGLRSGKLS